MSEEAVTEDKKELFELRLTKYEIVHLRDLFSVMLPPRLEKTMSQELAAIEARPLVEANLWNKIAKLAADANVHLADAAPDFVLGTVGIPEISVFRMATAPEELQEENADVPITPPFLAD